MSAHALLAEFEAAGVRLKVVGGNLRYRTRKGVGIAPFEERIRAHKSELIAALTPLDSDIVADEARRRSLACIARRIARIEARLPGSGHAPEDRTALRYWRAIRREKRKQALRMRIVAAVTAEPEDFDRALYGRLMDEWEALDTAGEQDPPSARR